MSVVDHPARYASPTTFNTNPNVRGGIDMPQPMKPSRRELFAGVAATAVAATALAAPPMSIAEVWERSRVMLNGPTMTDSEFDAFSELEMFVLKGPIDTNADLAAKLKAVGTGYEHGEHSDYSERRALAQAIEWIEAHGA